MVREKVTISTRTLQWKCVESRVDNKRLCYGRFILSPLIKDQADTIGIAMRRALLGEIEGTCITRALCTIRYLLCTMYYPLCIMHYTLYTMHYILCTMHYALCIRIYVYSYVFTILYVFIHIHYFTWKSGEIP